MPPRYFGPDRHDRSVAGAEEVRYHPRPVGP